LIAVAVLVLPALRSARAQDYPNRLVMRGFSAEIVMDAAVVIDPCVYESEA
jgi:hypothetical protein